MRSIDLQAGQVPPDVDTLVVIAPQNMTDKERYAIDQYLMRGGSVIVGAGNYAHRAIAHGRPGPSTAAKRPE